MGAALNAAVHHHIDAIAHVNKARGLFDNFKPGLRQLGRQHLERDRPIERGHGLHVLVPPAEDREIVHRVIYDELCRGIVREESRSQYRRIASDLVRAGATGLILGCTEITLLFGPEDASVPVFDTTRIHAEEAARYALAP